MLRALAILVLATSCARPGVASVASACIPAGLSPADSVRGVVMITGSEPGTSVVLRLANGSVPGLAGQRALLLQLSGVEVVVFGVRTRSGELQVGEVIVRAVDGEPAMDGILLRDAGGDFLRTCDGVRHRIGRLPEALRDKAGRRVWLVGSLESPAALGIVAR